MIKETNQKTIAFYIGSLARGGAEHVMVNLAAYFKSQGYKVYLVTKLIDEPEYEVPEGVDRIVADITKEEESDSRIANLKNRVKKLKNIWREIKPDIIVSFIRKNNLMAVASSRGLNIPVVVSIRSNPARELEGRFFKPLSFFMFRFVSGIIMQTTAGVEFLPGYLKKKAIVMPNSIDGSFVGDICEKERKLEIVLVGRIDKNKNQKMVLKVFDKIKDEYPNWNLHLYGDGESKEELQNEYRDDRIVFHGQVSGVKDYIKDSSIFVLPSKQEGMPNALIEAMALGLACISTDCPCGGPADLIKHDENGILIPVDDEKELEKQLVRLMNDANLRELLGKEATKISKMLSPDIVNAKWKEYIESKIAGL
jgi:glycosyltransferase involved in cell wall biosynthesis